MAVFYSLSQDKEKIAKLTLVGFASQLVLMPANAFISHNYSKFSGLTIPESYKNQIKNMSFFKFAIAIPILEEILFRKIIYNGITHSLYDNENNANSIVENKASAQNCGLVGSALLFAAAHHKIQRPGSFFNGITWGLLNRYHEESILPSIAAHTTNNALVFGVLRLAARKF